MSRSKSAYRRNRRLPLPEGRGVTHRPVGVEYAPMERVSVGFGGVTYWRSTVADDYGRRAWRVTPVDRGEATYEESAGE